MSREHDPILIDEFNGLWKRGDDESVPLDHFSDCQNIQYIHGGFKTRNGIDVFTVGADDCINLSAVLRIYMYVHNNEEGLLVLDTLGNIFHTKSPTPCTAILHVDGMTDFAMVSFAGRAYITPHNGVNGLEDEFLYVYMGDGSTARKAAGVGPKSATPMTAAVGAIPGKVELGYHVFAVIYETDTGFQTKLGPTNGTDKTAVDYYQFTAFLVPGGTAVDLANIPVSPDSYVVARHIVATKLIHPTNWINDLTANQFFFIPNGRIDNNTATTHSVDFFDSELLDDASHLLDLFEEIAAGVNLTSYHNRLVLVTQFGQAAVAVKDDTLGLLSTAWVSAPGEPEAIDSVDGAIVAPLDGNPLTNCQEYRDVLYLFKKTRTYAYNDNGDVPSSWPLTIIDQGVGASVHGIATVLDSGGVNVEYIIIIDWSGVMMFNGAYLRPELSWKIKDFWSLIDRDAFQDIQIANDSLGQILYITLPNQKLLFGDYTNSLDPKAIKWGIWEFPVQTTTIALINTNDLIIGSNGSFV